VQTFSLYIISLNFVVVFQFFNRFKQL